MDANGLTHLVFGLGIVGGALAGFNKLVGKGPRGTLWIVAACLFTWSSMLPIAVRDPDNLTLTREWVLIVSVLRMCGFAACAVGIFDLFQRRTSRERLPTAELILAQPVVWGLAVCINFFALLYQDAIQSALLKRYCAGHPIEIIELTVFFVGLSALVLRFVGVVGQFPSLRLAPASSGSRGRKHGRRLRAAFEPIGRKSYTQ